MNPLVIDTETTIYADGNPFSDRNKLCYVGLRTNEWNLCLDIEYSAGPYGEKIKQIQDAIDATSFVVVFNAHFDLHWLRRYGIRFNHRPIFDCQYGHFILSHQTVRFPSLDQAAYKYSIPGKFGYINENYWKKGIDTPLIPRQELVEYLDQDTNVTLQVFLKQLEEFNQKPHLKRLFWQGCKDLVITEEMEWNGLKYNLGLSHELGNKILSKITGLDSQLNAIAPQVSINWASNDHLSAVLYGGCYRYDVRWVHLRKLKDGRWTEKGCWRTVEIQLPRLVEPLERSQVAKEGYFQVNEKVLKKLKAYGKAKQIIEIILERSKLEKQVGTYYHGFPKLYKEMDWQDEVIHGQLNHCAAGTGRLSSSKPNQQNLDEGVRQCIVSRFTKIPVPRKLPKNVSSSSITP